MSINTTFCYTWVYFSDQFMMDSTKDTKQVTYITCTYMYIAVYPENLAVFKFGDFASNRAA